MSASDTSLAESALRPARLVVVVAVAAVLVTSACRPVSDPGLAAVRNAFSGAAPPPAPSGAPVMDLDVYIDASMSMRGFVQGAAGSSSYRQVLQHVLQTGTTGLYRMVRYKFSTAMESVDQADPNQFLLPGFFDGVDTSLHRLLDRISQKPYAGHISVLISDLVQSQTGTSQLALVQSLLRVAARGLELKLIGVRSSFDGLYYIESFPQVGQSYALKLNQALPGSGRPFYLLVIAPDRASMELLDKYVLGKLSGPDSFVPTDTPVVVKDIRPAWPTADPPWIRISQHRGGQSPSGASTWYTTFRERRAQGQMSPLALQYQTQTALPLDSARKIGIEVRKCVFDGRRFTKPGPVTIGVTAEKTGLGNGERLQLTYQLPRPAPKVWEVYQIRMRPGEGNLAPPQWVRAWSTDSDQSPMAGNKTYQLALLVEAMVRAITEKNAFCEHYIAVRRGN